MRRRELSLRAGIALPCAFLGFQEPAGAKDQPDAKLLALLAETRRRWETTRKALPRRGQTLGDLMAAASWEDPMRQAAMMPALTPEGRRAKAETACLIMGYGPHDMPEYTGPSERLMMSLFGDCMRDGGQS